MKDMQDKTNYVAYQLKWQIPKMYYLNNSENALHTDTITVQLCHRFLWCNIIYLI